MNDPDPLDGTAIPAVHGDAIPTRASGVPVHPSPPEATGQASRAPERDTADGPRSVPPARSGDQAATDAHPGQAHVWNQRNICTLCGHDPLAAVRAAQAEQGRRQRAQRGRYTRIADRAAGATYKPGSNRRGGRQ